MTIEEFITQISRPMFIWRTSGAILANKERYSPAMVRSAETRHTKAETEIAALIQRYSEDGK